MKRPRRELSIDKVIHLGTFKNNQNTLFPSFTFIPQTGVYFYTAAYYSRRKVFCFP